MLKPADSRAASEPAISLHSGFQSSAELARTPEKNWRFTFGVDVFTGPMTGLFGRFNDNDRAYVELRYDF